MMVEYKLTEKFTQGVIDELLKISEKHGMTPENIVQIAKNKKSLLHNFFEWDDSAAAAKFRLHQARILVNEVKVIIDDKVYYAFENIKPVTILSNLGAEEKANNREYKPIVQILSQEELRQQVVRSALNHLAYWEKQNEKYSELSPIIQSAKKVREKLEKKWQKKKK